MPRAKPCGCICGRKTGSWARTASSLSRIAGEVLKVEFLGSSCLAEFRVEELEGQSLHLSFSLHQLKDLGVRAGARIQLALRSERIRVFPARAKASA